VALACEIALTAAFVFNDVRGTSLLPGAKWYALVLPVNMYVVLCLLWLTLHVSNPRLVALYSLLFGSI